MKPGNRPAEAMVPTPSEVRIPRDEGKCVICSLFIMKRFFIISNTVSTIPELNIP